MRLIQMGRPVPSLLVLCRKYGIDVREDVSSQELNSQLQQKWFKDGYLRYQIKGEPPNAEDYALLRELGFIDEVRPFVEFPPEYPPSEPCPVIYEGALLLGALRAPVVRRLHYFTTVVDNIYFQRKWNVSLFGGARPLDPIKEHPDILCAPQELPFRAGWTSPEQMPTTEVEMMEFVWQQSQLPSEWKYELVNTPLQPKDLKNPDGEKRPPNTGDTMREWVTKCKPRPGYYLALSHQPFVECQELSLQRLAPEGFTIYACGPQSSLTLPLANYLDNIAKQLYEELQVKKW